MKHLILSASKILFFSSVLLFVTLLGCKDDSPTPTSPPDQETEEPEDIPKNSLQSVEVPNAWKTDVFYRNGKISGFASFGDTLSATHENDLLTKFESQQQEITIKYDGNDRITESVWTSAPNIYRYVYEYVGSSDQASKVSFYRTYREDNKWVEKLNVEMSNVQYNSEGGLVSCDRVYYDYGNDKTYNDAFTFELSDKPNMLFGNILYLTYPQFTYGLANLGKFSKQYVTGYTFGAQSSGEDFVYEYDKDYPDYITKFIRHPNSSPTERIYTWNR